MAVLVTTRVLGFILIGPLPKSFFSPLYIYIYIFSFFFPTFQHLRSFITSIIIPIALIVVITNRLTRKEDCFACLQIVYCKVLAKKGQRINLYIYI